MYEFEYNVRHLIYMGTFAFHFTTHRRHVWTRICIRIMYHALLKCLTKQPYMD